MTGTTTIVFMQLLLSLASISLGVKSDVPPAPANEKITDLPGLPYEIGYEMYSGYLNATTKGHEQYFFYWLAESQSSHPEKDPLVLWLSGGPGCSSLGGMLEELGPFRNNYGGKTLYENRFAWNKQANVLFLESPTGVGFSYAVDGNDATNDDKVAQDNYAALLDFHRKFPKYNQREFFITGESYAGIYIPTLAAVIVDAYNHNKNVPVKLGGLAIGNGMLSFREQANSAIHLLYYRGVIGYETWENVNQLCCGGPDITCNYDAHLKEGQDAGDYKSDGTACGDAANNLTTVLVAHSLNDYYNQYQDCYTGKVSQIERLKATVNVQFPDIKIPKGDTVPDLARIINYDSTDTKWGYPCWQDDALTTYLNREDVKKAIHVHPDRMKIRWATCNDTVNMHLYNVTHFDVYPEFKKILNDSDARILVYNGDVDSACNFLGDEWFVRNVSKMNNLDKTQERTAWKYRGQIAGYVKPYGPRLHLLTVKGSGHFVPMDRPGPALQMITNFINNVQNYSSQANVNVELHGLFEATTEGSANACIPATIALIVAVCIPTLFSLVQY